MVEAGRGVRVEEKELTVRLLTASGCYAEWLAVWAAFFAADGALQIYAGHAPLMTVLKPGPLRVMCVESSKPRLYTMGEGVAIVKLNQLTLMATTFTAVNKLPNFMPSLV